MISAVNELPFVSNLTISRDVARGRSGAGSVRGARFFRRRRFATAASRLRLLVTAVVACALLAACGDSNKDLVNQQYTRVQGQVSTLRGYISGGRIRNANLIRHYAKIVAEDRPELKDLTGELAKEGTTGGLAYSSLVNRLKKIKRDPANDKEAGAAAEDLLRIEAAADWSVFNDSLADVVNVLADLSNGKLARLHIPKSEAKPKEGAGSYLVGNPRYGQWRNNSSGQSFWAWYGQYALFRSVFFGPSAYSYGRWYGGRSWSYYGDVGRHYYGTRGDSARWNRASTTYRNTTPRKSYGSVRSQRRLSTYGRAGTRTQGSALRRASTYASSSRSGSSRGSRGK